MKTPLDEEKYCYVCKITHLRTAFYRNRSKPDGFADQCKMASNQQVARWVDNHSQARWAIQAQSRERHRDKANKNKREKYARDPSVFLAQQRKRYLANPTLFIRRGNKWKQTHPEEARRVGKAWVQKNIMKVRKQKRLNEGKRRARKKNVAADFTRQDEERLLAYWHYACAVCGRENGLWYTIALDHWIPLVDPKCPGTVPWNMVPLCHAKKGIPSSMEPCCNNQKYTHSPKTWLIRKFGPSKAKNKLKEIERYFTTVVDDYCRDKGLL